MTTNNHQPASIEMAAGRRRHPSAAEPMSERRYRVDAAEEGSSERLSLLAAHLHDFFRYGDPAGTPALEAYLYETGSGLYAEVVLDELEALIVKGDRHVPGTPGAAA